MTASDVDTIDVLAERIHRWIALEDLLFETLGRWVRSVPEPGVKRMFATWCHRHAWHAELWRARQPVYRGRADADALDERLSAETVAWIEPLRRALADADQVSTDAKMTVLANAIVPTMRTALDEHCRAVDPRLDGPTARVLALITFDLDAERVALTP